MKLIYIAGPYRDRRGEYWVGENIRKAREVMLTLVRWGYAAFCPHTQSAYCGGALDDDYRWLEVDKEILGRCDAVVVLSGWENSEGTMVELRHALTNGIPRFAWDNARAQTFLRQHVLSPGKLEMAEEGGR